MQEELDELYTPWIENSKVFSCTFDIATNSITLEQNYNEDYLELMLIKSSNKIPMILTLDDVSISKYLLITPEELAKTSKLFIKAQDKALYWDSSNTSANIIDKSNKYSFYLSTNLESETGGYICTIKL